MATSWRQLKMAIRRQDGSAAHDRWEVMMDTMTRGAVALALGATIISAGAPGAYAQSEDSPDDSETAVAAGTLDDGQDLLPLATISLEQAIATAQGAATGALGEVDLEYVDGTLAFNVDVGEHDVQVDAQTGDILAVAADD
jgi:uncharacterized membrane protein YkoI